ncbi:TetR/AcrR family transcriptional regulator [Rathayibacter sp. CAU 1779]
MKLVEGKPAERTTVARGRPRGFDLDVALDRAIEVFWRQGYEGTSLSDLTEAMGINRPSLYAAFGNKENTFRLAVQRYGETTLDYLDEALAQPTARAVAEHYLHDNVRAITKQGRPRGCLSVQAGSSSAPEDRSAIEFVVARREGGEARFAERFARAIEEGDLPADEDPRDLAKYLFTLATGLAVQAAAGVSRARLKAVAVRALSAFPSPQPRQES